LNLSCITVADPGIFQRGGSTLKVGFQRGGSTIILGFQRGFHPQNVLFLPYFEKIFWRKGGFRPPEPPLWIRQCIIFSKILCIVFVRNFTLESVHDYSGLSSHNQLSRQFFIVGYNPQSVLHPFCYHLSYSNKLEDI
jgi:hypothetical protein